MSDPKPRRRGRPTDPDCLEVVAYEMALRSLGHGAAAAKTSPRAGGPDKSTGGLPEQDKRRIASIYRVTTRTITNMQRVVHRFFAEPSELPAGEERSAVLRGVAHAIAVHEKKRAKPGKN